MNASLAEFARDCQDELDTGYLERETQIVEWGKWSKGGYPTGEPSENPTPNITDDDALKVDAQVARLPSRTKVIIMEIYIHDQGVNELARTLNISSRRVAAYRDQGLNIIYGALSLSA